MVATTVDVIESPQVLTPVTPPRSSSRFQRVWPLAAIALGLIVTVSWTAFLGYGLVRLVALAL